MTTQTERASGMRDFKVHGEHVPVFRDQAKRWYDGDTIGEEDLLRLFTPAHIEMLVEGEALEVLVVEDPPGEAKDSEDPPARFYCDDPSHSPEGCDSENCTGPNPNDVDPVTEANADASDPPMGGKKKAK